MPVVVLPKASFWTLVAQLRQFDGWRWLWRLPIAALAYALPALLFVGATVLAAYVAGDDFDLAKAILSAIVVVGPTAFLAPRLARRELHRKIITDRLWTFRKPNPATEVPVLLRSPDAEAARTALRRAKFNPHVDLNLDRPPDDAPDLDLNIAVHEPEAWPQSTSDEDRTTRIAGTLERAEIRARVGGLDVFPARNGATDADGRRTRDGRRDFASRVRT